jgi:hypothetical protein
VASRQSFVLPQDVVHFPDEVGPVDADPFEIAQVDGQLLLGRSGTLMHFRTGHGHESYPITGHANRARAGVPTRVGPSVSALSKDIRDKRPNNRYHPGIGSRFHPSSMTAQQTCLGRGDAALKWETTIKGEESNG